MDAVGSALELNKMSGVLLSAVVMAVIAIFATLPLTVLLGIPLLRSMVLQESFSASWFILTGAIIGLMAGFLTPLVIFQAALVYLMAPLGLLCGMFIGLTLFILYYRPSKVGRTLEAIKKATS